MKNKAEIIGTNEIILTAKAPKAYNSMLFSDRDGLDVTAGDIVEFNVDGDVNPHSGYVCNYNGLKIASFNQLLNKWLYRDISVV